MITTWRMESLKVNMVNSNLYLNQIAALKDTYD